MFIKRQYLHLRVPLILAFAVSAMVLAVSAMVLKVRYPETDVWSSAVHVAGRISWIAKSHLGLFGPYGASTDRVTELANVEKMLLAVAPGLADVPPLRRALILRELVYRRVPLRRTATGFNFRDLDSAVYLAVFDDDYGHICRGLVNTYLTILRAFDIPARNIGIYNNATDAPNPVTSHASVEVFINGEWVAMDPTFNFSVHDSAGRRIGWQEARRAIQAGKPIRFDDDGYGTLPKRSLMEYAKGNIANFTSTMNYLTFGPALVAGKRIAAQKLPPQWDGVVRYRNGRKADVEASASSWVYEALAAPLGE